MIPLRPVQTERWIPRRRSRCWQRVSYCWQRLALLEVALTIPEEQPATAMAAALTAMDLVSLRENIC